MTPLNQLHVFKLKAHDGSSPMEYWDAAIKAQVKQAVAQGIPHVTSWSWYGHEVGGPKYLLVLVNPSQYFIDQVNAQVNIVETAIDVFDSNLPLGFRIKTRPVCIKEPIYPEFELDDDGLKIIPPVTPPPIGFKDVPVNKAPSEEIVYYGEET